MTDGICYTGSLNVEKSKTEVGVNVAQLL